MAEQLDANKELSTEIAKYKRASFSGNESPDFERQDYQD
jgi:hypothetical protein